MLVFFLYIVYSENDIFGGIMGVTAVCGINWGDEGKGRMVDYFAGTADFIIRFQGGNNAYHRY